MKKKLMEEKFHFWYITVRILWILFLPAVDEAELLQKYVCENQNLSIDCGEGIIDIHDAIYGRNKSEYCVGPNYDNYNRPCISERSLTVVTRACVNKSSCSIRASNSEFGDPCVNVFKYLEVGYTCDIPCACRRANEVCEENSTGVACVCKTNFQRDAFNICRSEHNDTSTTGLCDLSKINVTTDNVGFVAAQLEKESHDVDRLTPKDINLVLDIFSNIVQVKNPSQQVTTSLISTTNNLMEVSSEVIDQVSEVGSIPSMLEDQVTSLLSIEHNYTEIMSNIAVAALHVNTSTSKTTNISFGSYSAKNTSEKVLVNLSCNTTQVYLSETESKDAISTITLPSVFLDSFVRANLGQKDIPLSFYLFKDAKLFPIYKEKGVLGNVRHVVSSQVISMDVAIDGLNIKNLHPNESVLARFYSFPVSRGNEEKEELSCVYWKYNKTFGRGEWDTDGCKMIQSNGRYITCLCNHLTSFAVLVRVTNYPYKSTPVLDVITAIGRILSIIGLSICVVTSLVMKETRRKQLTQIHINLSIALIALYATFSIGIKSTGDNARCKITASLIHFFCLSSMAWMSVEAFNMFVFLWTMRRSNIRHLLLIGSLFSWGVPFAVSLSVYLFDESNNFKDVHDYCFLNPGFSLYIGFLLPIFMLFSFNFVVFILITYRVSCRKILATNEEARRKAEVARIKGPIVFWILLGLSWMFGFLTIFITPLKVLFELLFSLCLSLQGVFMFYVLTLNNPEIKVELKRYRDLITAAVNRSVTSQLPLRSFISSQHIDVNDEIHTASTNDIPG